MSEEYTPTFVLGSSSEYDSKEDYPEGFCHGDGVDWTEPYNGPQNVATTTRGQTQKPPLSAEEVVFDDRDEERPGLDDLVSASLQSVTFESPGDFEDLLARHGLRHVESGTETIETAMETFEFDDNRWVADVSNRGDRGGIAIDPLEMRCHGVSADPRATEEHDGRAHASYLDIRGPLSATLDLYGDIFETATKIKRELRPLKTVDLGCNTADGEVTVAEGQGTEL